MARGKTQIMTCSQEHLGFMSVYYWIYNSFTKYSHFRTHGFRSTPALPQTPWPDLQWRCFQVFLLQRPLESALPLHQDTCPQKISRFSEPCNKIKSCMLKRMNCSNTFFFWIAFEFSKLNMDKVSNRLIILIDEKINNWYSNTFIICYYACACNIDRWLSHQLGLFSLTFKVICSL